jgi:hypothetical protein
MLEQRLNSLNDGWRRRSRTSRKFGLEASEIGSDAPVPAIVVLLCNDTASPIEDSCRALAGLINNTTFVGLELATHHVRDDEHQGTGRHQAFKSRQYWGLPAILHQV